ncbi:MAG: chromosome segregation protein ScpA [Caldilineae bacterium]|nr:MAG: chromosome segregation protein ScpA [Caldilineae bacterium]
MTLLPDSPPADDRYHVRLPDFFGPMDLLLALIEQEELEITAISLAQITDQYLAYLNTLQHLTPDTLTDFLVVAARLLLLKSQVLLPKPPPSILAEEEESETDDLVQQLKDYKRFKELAAELNRLQNEGGRSFVRLAPPPKIEPRLELGDVTLDDLLDATRRALAVKPEPPGVDTVVARETVTIGQQIDRIRRHLQSGQRTTFFRLLHNARSRVEVIVTLLAVLELVKRQVIEVEQSEDFGDIQLIRREDVSLSEDDWAALTQMEEVS